MTNEKIRSGEIVEGPGSMVNGWVKEIKKRRKAFEALLPDGFHYLQLLVDEVHKDKGTHFFAGVLEGWLKKNDCSLSPLAGRILNYLFEQNQIHSDKLDKNSMVSFRKDHWAMGKEGFIVGDMVLFRAEFIFPENDNDFSFNITEYFNHKQDEDASTQDQRDVSALYQGRC